MKTVAVIPAYNEEDTIADAVRDALAYTDAVVVIDDASSDATGEKALHAGAFLLRHVVNRGQGAALQTGTDFAVSTLQADIIVHFDADLQMQGKEIPQLIKCLSENNADIVLGSRFLGKASNMPLSRRLTLRLAWVFTVLVSGIRVSDTHNGFRALTRKAAQQIRLRSDRMAHASELLDCIRIHKLHFVECPVTIRYTEHSLKKGMRFTGGFTVLKDYFKSKLF